MKKILRLEKFSTKNENFISLDSTTSKGAQPKWRYLSDGLFIKQDHQGTESLAEWVVYQILDKCSTVAKERIVPYYLCEIDGVDGCYSKDFKNREDEITLADVFAFQRQNINKIFNSKTPEERLVAIEDILEAHTGKRFDYELKLMFAVDALFLNEDRHMSNISVLEDSEGKFRMSPLFDNGLSLLSRLTEYSKDIPLSTHLSKVKPILLSTKFKKHIELYNYEPFLDRGKIEEFLEEHEEELGRIYYILKRQIKQEYLQKLFIKPKAIISSSSIFTKP